MASNGAQMTRSTSGAPDVPLRPPSKRAHQFLENEAVWVNYRQRVTEVRASHNS